MPSGTAVKLDVALPSLRGHRSGALLHTVGHVVRSEESGFAAAADMGFRMQMPESLTDSVERAVSNANGKNEAHGRRRSDDRVAPFSL